MRVTGRLNRWDRDAIVSKAAEAAFEKREVAIANREDELCRSAYAMIIKSSERDAAKAMPKGWLRHDTSLRMNIGGMDVTLRLAHGAVPTPYDQDYRLGNIADPDFVQLVTKFLGDKESLKAERNTAERNVRALVGSVTTFKRLAEIWPEGKPFYEERAKKRGAVVNLPAPIVADVNKMLGLTEAA